MSKQNSLSPVTYKVDQMDDRKNLSTQKRIIAPKITCSNGTKYGDKTLRFIDIHKRNKEWVPPVTKYNYTAEQMRKNTSSSPLGLKHKK